jgi:hypothetical protein
MHWGPPAFAQEFVSEGHCNEWITAEEKEMVKAIVAPSANGSGTYGGSNIAFKILSGMFGCPIVSFDASVRLSNALATLANPHAPPHFRSPAHMHP